MSEASAPAPSEQWVRLELMGHRVRFGKMTEVTVAGAPFLRIELPLPTGPETELYAPSAVYGIKLLTEQNVRDVYAAHERSLLGPGGDDDEDDALGESVEDDGC